MLIFLPCISLVSCFPLRHIGEEQKYSLFFLCVCVNHYPSWEDNWFKKEEEEHRKHYRLSVSQSVVGGEQKFIRNK